MSLVYTEADNKEKRKMKAKDKKNIDKKRSKVQTPVYQGPSLKLRWVGVVQQIHESPGSHQALLLQHVCLLQRHVCSCSVKTFWFSSLFVFSTLDGDINLYVPGAKFLKVVGAKLHLSEQ